MRLIWLVGPPGAGKTTFVRNQGIPYVEFDHMLRPLIAPWNLERGVLHAHGHLVKVIRSICLQPKSPLPNELIVVAGTVKEPDLFPLQEGEEVWLLLPDHNRWLSQLSNRPKMFDGIPQYSELEYANEMYDYFRSWENRSRMKKIDTKYNVELVGRVPEEYPVGISQKIGPSSSRNK